MSETDFEQLADRTLVAVENAIETAGAPVDVELRAGGVLELEFDDGRKIIVNRHGPAREIWVAARQGGFHFRCENGSWRDTRSGEELFATLNRLISAQCGRAIELRA